MTHTYSVGYEDYVVPDDVDDPEAAALELIVSKTQRDVGKIVRQSGHDWNPLPLRLWLQQFSAALEVDGTFRDMTWHDAKFVAKFISTDLFVKDGRPGEAMADASMRALAGRDEIPWDDKKRASEAFHSAAMIYPRV